MKNSLFLLIICSLYFSCKTSPKANNSSSRGVVSENAMVVSARVEASNIGIEILKKGGNAFDAMVATEMALAVAFPYAGNLGGGGFMVYREANGDIGCLDYREKAPLAATKEMYLDSSGNVIEGKSTIGAMAVGVPGTVAGVFAVHETFGTLPIEEILQPVIDLAIKGVVITKKQAKRLHKYRDDFNKANKDDILFSKEWSEDDIFYNLGIVNTLHRLARHGKEDFYQGEIAKDIVKFIQGNGGVITLEDLAQYEAVWRTPVTFEYDNLRVISMAPPSSGGICLAQIMKSIESYNLKEMGHNTIPMMQVIVEAERRSYADRSFYLGDPDFVDIPADVLISDDYLQGRMADFSFDKATKSEDITHGDVAIVESDETTHYSIVDAFGNAISVTTTLNSAYGSKLLSDELGFFFNNEMDDFSAKPGVPNVYGLIGAEANSILPEKRMLSSMTPTIVEKDGEFWLSVGTPGGSTIITSVLQTILNIHEYGMGAQEAVSAERFHHQWLPDVIRIEPNRFSQETIKELTRLGYSINEENSTVIGKVEAILALPDGRLEGGADPRGDDRAVGY